MNQITVADIAALDQMGPEEEKRFWEVFGRELSEDDGAAAAGHLAAGRPIYYVDDEYPDEMVRKWPGGRREFVDVSEDGTVTVVGTLPHAI
jgi:hypothetical protein